MLRCIPFPRYRNKIMTSKVVVHTGGCHCKNVRWRVQAPTSAVAWCCNCSNCSLRSNTHFIVPAKRFEILGNSEQFLTTYSFVTHKAKHTFCKICGITSFYYPRSNPDGVAITYKCVDPGTLAWPQSRLSIWMGIIGKNHITSHTFLHNQSQTLETKAIKDRQTGVGIFSSQQRILSASRRNCYIHHYFWRFKYSYVLLFEVRIKRIAAVVRCVLLFLQFCSTLLLDLTLVTTLPRVSTSLCYCKTYIHIH